MKDNTLTGFHADLIKHVSKELKTEITFNAYPWKRAIYLTQNGKADAITFMSKNPERSKHFYFIKGNELSHTEFIFIVREEDQEKISYDGNLENLKDLTIGIQLGYYYGQKFSQATDLNVATIKTSIQLEKMLLSKRLQVILFSKKEYLNQKESGCWKNTIPLKVPLHTNTVYIAFRKSPEIKQIAHDFAQAMLKFKKSPEYQRLYSLYFHNSAP